LFHAGFHFSPPAQADLLGRNGISEKKNVGQAHAHPTPILSYFTHLYLKSIIEHMSYYTGFTPIWQDQIKDFRLIKKNRKMGCTLFIGITAAAQR
jgi:hypothetical protein